MFKGFWMRLAQSSKKRIKKNYSRIEKWILDSLTSEWVYRPSTIVNGDNIPSTLAAILWHFIKLPVTSLTTSWFLFNSYKIPWKMIENRNLNQKKTF